MIFQYGTSLFAGVIAITLMVSASAQADPIVLDNFNNGVSYISGSPDPMPDNTWLEGRLGWNTQASPGTFNGSPAMQIIDLQNSGSDSASIRNGLYARFPNAIPADGEYIVRCWAKFHEEVTYTGTPQKYEPYQSYMVGVSLNTPHRAANKPIARPTTAKTEKLLDSTGALYFTDANDSGKEAVVLQTPTFTATAGDDLSVAFSTYPTFNFYSTENWNGSYITIDDLELVPLMETPVSLSGWELE